MKTLAIPVRPHVLKYLQVHLPQPYALTQGDQFGLYLKIILLKKLEDAKKDPFVAKCTDELAVELGSYKQVREARRHLTSNTIFLFNDFVHKILLKEMHGHVRDKTEEGWLQRAAIENFMGKYGYTDQDIAYDTLKKSYQRYLADEKQRLKEPVRTSTPDWRKELAELKRKLLALPVAAAGLAAAVS